MKLWQQNLLYNQSLDLLKGRGGAKDPELAFRLNAEVAAEGHGDAVLAMGWFYLNGVGVTRDIGSAGKWYHDSAHRGDKRAMFSLGQIAYDEDDYADALVWFRRAADARHHRSLYFLGRHYWRGHGVEQDKKEAMRYFQRAAGKKVKEAQRVLRFFARKLIADAARPPQSSSSP